MPDHEQLANQLGDARKRLGLTQADLAEKVGVSRKTINTIENGVFVPSAGFASVSATTRKAS